MSARSRAQKRLQLHVPNYEEKADEKDRSNQPTIDVYADVPQSVILDDVTILKGDIGLNGVTGTLIPPKFNTTFWSLPHIAFFDFNFGSSNANAPTICNIAGTEKVCRAWGNTRTIGPVTYNAGDFFLNKAGYWEIECSIGMWLGGSTTDLQYVSQDPVTKDVTTLSNYINPGIPFSYSILMTEVGTNKADRIMVNGDGRELWGQKNSHVYIKHVRGLGNTTFLPFAVNIMGNCKTNEHTVSSTGWIKFTLLSSY